MALAMVLAKIVACTICLAVASFIVLVVLPVKMSVWGKAELLGSMETFLEDESQFEIQAKFEVALLGGIIKFSPKKKELEASPHAVQPETKFAGSMGSIRPYLARGVRQEFVRFLKRVLGATHFAANLHLTYGLQDPALTGLIYGAYQAISGCLGVSQLQLTPVFAEELLELTGFVEVRTIPALLSWHALVFVMSSNVRPLWRGKLVNLRRLPS